MVENDGVRAMLGLVDRSYVLDLLGHVAGGEPKEALTLFRELTAAGGDPKTVVEDLLALTHELTRDKLAPEAAAPERAELAAKLGLPVLARAWQVLLKGLDEVGQAPDGAAAAEMLLVRLAWTAGTPGETGRELAQALHALTGRRWGVDAAPSDAPTLAERDEARLRARMEEARHWPQVRAVLDKIPGATIVGVEMRTDDDAPVSPPRQEGSLSG
jgi:DNA polymerase-3 subunit gamma/tau